MSLEGGSIIFNRFLKCIVFTGCCHTRVVVPGSTPWPTYLLLIFVLGMRPAIYSPLLLKLKSSLHHRISLMIISLGGHLKKIQESRYKGTATKLYNL